LSGWTGSKGTLKNKGVPKPIIYIMSNFFLFSPSPNSCFEWFIMTVSLFDFVYQMGIIIRILDYFANEVFD